MDPTNRVSVKGCEDVRFDARQMDNTEREPFISHTYLQRLGSKSLFFAVSENIFETSMAPAVYLDVSKSKAV